MTGAAHGAGPVTGAAHGAGPVTGAAHGPVAGAARADRPPVR